MRTLIACALATALTLGLGGTPAAAQRSRGDVLADPRLAPQRDALQAVLNDASADGLPAEWIRDKIAEGLSKRVPPARILAASRALLGQMREADRLVAELGPRSGAGRRLLLRAALDALLVGAPPGHLRRAIASADPAARATSARRILVAIAELGERGFGGRAAADAVATARRRGGDHAMRELMRQARAIRGEPGRGRDASLERASRGRGTGGGPDVDRDRGGRDHGRDVGRGPPDRR